MLTTVLHNLFYRSRGSYKSTPKEEKSFYWFTEEVPYTPLFLQPPYVGTDPPPPHLSRDPQAPQMDSVVPRTSMTPPPPALVRSSLVQSTSFLDSVPVTLTMEPRDWMSADEAGSPRPSSRRREEREKLRAAAVTPPVPPATPRGYEVELKRRPGEGFGFVIASQDVENGRGEAMMDSVEDGG
ncbi:hypothetical protein AALO_G00054260 [Alosa alosa]|uniref:PDZ domain-containing protein n=1 Tax=Alosa alosa TaxID=278164 RepID=A0AAV6HA36_9TELE|nr:hypothetical protein AALO_G00054260 [Alosa alosa]